MTADEADRFTRRRLRALRELPSAQRAVIVERICARRWEHSIGRSDHEPET
jgi:hypothetical protein